MLALATQTAWSQAASRLEKVELHPQPGEQVEVRLVLDGPAPAPVTFTIDNPARLAVDLPGTALALDSRRIDVKSGGVDTIVAAEASGRTRLVFNLDRMQPYNVRTEGNTVFVTVGGGAMATAAAPAATTAAQAAAAPIGGATTIQKVDFRRTSDGGGRIVVQTIGGAGRRPASSARVADSWWISEHAGRRRPGAPLRRNRFRHPHQLLRCYELADRRTHRRRRDRRLRAGGLPDRP
jgi:type IV pilus assembly protein PilQ